MKSILYLFLAGLISSCAFNKQFFQPNTNAVRTPPGASSHYVNYGENDSIHTLFFERESPIASIFILHGNAGNLESWGEVGDLFHQGGYQVFIIDYPEFGNSTGKADYKAVFESTQNAVDFYRDLPNVASGKNLLMGFSLGGNLALKAGTENDSLFDALLIEGAFESQKAMGSNQFPRPFRFLPYLLVKNQVKGRDVIQKWQKPLMIVHSKEDAVCPYRMGQNLYKAAINTKQKELWTIKGPHLAGLGSDFSLYMAKVQKLVDQIP